jgi:hypothetical protein
MNRTQRAIKRQLREEWNNIKREKNRSINALKQLDRGNYDGEDGLDFLDREDLAEGIHGYVYKERLRRKHIKDVTLQLSE